MTKVTLAAGLGTGGVQNWIVNNMIPLLLLAVALLLLWMGGGQGKNHAVMARLGGVFVALGIIGIALTGAGVDLSKWLAGLFQS